MTIEERAQKAFDAFMNVHYMEMTNESVMTAITQALRDQIEDCAILMDKHAVGFQVLIDHAPTPIRAEDMKRVKHSIEVCAKEIRALAGTAGEKQQTQSKGD